MAQPAGNLEDDHTGYRLLYNVDFVPSLDQSGQFVPYPSGTWISFGVLRTEIDTTNSDPTVFDPFENGGQLDTQWLFRYSWPLCGAWAGSDMANGPWTPSNPYFLSQLLPNRQFYFDIPLRRGRGTTTSKRECLVLVNCLNICDVPEPPDLIVGGKETWSILLSQS